MDAYETRLASFAPKKPSRSKKQQAAASGWPHPPSFRATPSRLAQAGFYFEPSTSKPDNVLCFMCGYALGNWEDQDDPFKVHVEHSPKCAWAIARCSIEDDKRGNKYVLQPSSITVYYALNASLSPDSCSRLLLDFLPPVLLRKLVRAPSKVHGLTIASRAIRRTQKR